MSPHTGMTLVHIGENVHTTTSVCAANKSHLVKSQAPSPTSNTRRAQAGKFSNVCS